jgi:hypothetical protein
MNRVISVLNNRYLVAAVVLLFLVIPIVSKVSGR